MCIHCERKLNMVQHDSDIKIKYSVYLRNFNF